MRWLFALALALFGVGLARDQAALWVARTALPPLALEVGTEVRAADGSLLRAYTVEDGRWRLAVTPEAVDPGFIRLLLTYEDRRFYHHKGVDPWAMLRAVGQALRHHRVVSGGSTLTMQVARLLEGSGTGRMAGKIRQIRLALALEQQLSKAQILGLYLHLAPYGGNIEGLRAASLSWLGKEPARLTAAEAALLVALPQAPQSRRPDRFPIAARAARDRVLARGARFGVLSAEQILAAQMQDVPRARRDFARHAPHLADRLRLGTPGVDVHMTHVNLRVQTQLETLAEQALFGQDPLVQLAIVVMEHGSGRGIASVGSVGFDPSAQGYVDFTHALRSPGSTLKPFVYGLAMEQGLIHTETLIEDRPMRFGAYAPQNFDRQFRGTLSVRAALQASLNVPVVAVLERLGPARLAARLQAAGASLAYRGAPGLAIGLGGAGITLEDLVQLYGGLANGGRVIPLHFSGPPPPERSLMDRASAWQIGHILADVPPPAHAPRGRVAFKTGTSYGHRDTWAIGFDGRHVVGVWLGRADGTPVPGAFGAALAAPLMFEAFARISPTRTALPPPPPETLRVSASALPLPLRHFGRPQAEDGPRIAFPPDGAVLELQPDLPLIPRVRDGQPPYAWLRDGVPLGQYPGQTVDLGLQTEGFITLTVIDAQGRAARTHIELRQP